MGMPKRKGPLRRRMLGANLPTGEWPKPEHRAHASFRPALSGFQSHQHHLRGLLNPSLLVPTQVSDPQVGGGAQDTGCVTSSQVTLMSQIRGTYFENHWFRPMIFQCFKAGEPFGQKKSFGGTNKGTGRRCARHFLRHNSKPTRSSEGHPCLQTNH